MTCAVCSKPVAACVCLPGGCGIPGHVTGGEGTGPGATHWCETCRLLAEAGRLCAEATRLAGAAGVGGAGSSDDSTGYHMARVT